MARGTVSDAYGQLAAEGYLVSRQGAPTRVGWAPPRPPPPAVTPAPPAGPRWDFRPGRPASASFPRDAWIRAYRRAVADTPDEVFGYADVRGRVELRRALADYLARARGVETDLIRLLICGGFTQALTLACHALRARGTTTLAVEDPCAPRYRRLAVACGLTVVPVRCDEDGLRTDELVAADADAVLVTPAHQYPLGATLSAARRTALVEWARRTGALIIEDDYDGEFRYDRQPVGALQQMDPDHVMYAGTCSKTLAPGLRLGWLTTPRSLGDRLAAAKESSDRGNSALDQAALAELMTSGGFDRHVRAMRATYRRRRDQLVRALADNAPLLRPAGISAGLHALIYLPEHGTPEHQLRLRAARQGIALHTLTEYWHRSWECRPRAIVVGYGTPADHAYRPALSALIELLRQ